MKKELSPRVLRTFNIFADAVNQGLLAKGDCGCCAVGNLVRHGMGIPSKSLEEGIAEWNKQSRPFLNFRGFYSFNSEKEWRKIANWGLCFASQCGTQNFDEEELKDSQVQDCINATEFSLEELMIIESTFEGNTNIPIYQYPHRNPEDIREDQIRGLTAVMNVILEFDEVENSEEAIQEHFIDKLQPVV